MEFSQDLRKNLQKFAKQHGFAGLYRKYNWGGDTWENGFPSILELEKDMVEKAKKNLVEEEDIRRVVKWGGGNREIEWSETVELHLYDGKGDFKKEIRENPSVVVRELKEQKERGLISGLGVTYLSKTLRFAAPSEFGAIDTHIVRVFGQGDNHSKRQNWLSLKVCRGEGGQRWHILEQSMWPEGYGEWIDILRFLADFLNESGRICPHPEPFYKKSGLRQKGFWVCADVEMALFSYACKHSKSCLQ